MKRTFIFLLLLVALGNPVWSQKRVAPVAKALTKTRAAKLNEKQILEATRLHVGQYGRRPRTEIYNRKKLLTVQLTLQQKAEVRLGRAIYALLKQAKQDPSRNTPTVQKIRGLVEQFPSHPQPKSPATLLTQLRAFIKEHGHRPRSAFYDKGLALPSEQLSAKQLEEVRLAHALYRLLARSQNNAALRRSEEVDQIRQLFMQYPVTVPTRTPFSVFEQLPRVTQEVRAFIEQHKRKPKVDYYQNGLPLSDAKLTSAQQQEVQLGRDVRRILSYATKHNLTQVPALKTLRDLLAPYQGNYSAPAPSVLEVLEQTRTFIAQNGHRPKSAFLDGHGQPKTLNLLTPQEAQEVQLAGLINRAFERAKKGKSSAEEEEPLQALRTLVKQYPNAQKRDDTLFWQDVLVRLKQFTERYGYRPRGHIYEGGVTLSKDEMSPEQLEEVRLGRQLNQIIFQANTTGQTDHPLIGQLRQLADEFANASPADIQSVTEQLRQFIQTYHRRPHTNILQENRPLKNAQLTAEELAEVRLGRTVARLLDLTQGTPAPGSPLATLQELLAPYSNNNRLDPSLMVLKLEAFIQQHHHRPHTNFTPGTPLSAEQKEELRIGQQCYSIVRRADKNPDEMQDPSVEKIVRLWKNTPLK